MLVQFTRDTDSALKESLEILTSRTRPPPAEVGARCARPAIPGWHEWVDFRDHSVCSVLGINDAHHRGECLPPEALSIASVARIGDSDRQKPQDFTAFMLTDKPRGNEKASDWVVALDRKLKIAMHERESSLHGFRKPNGDMARNSSPRGQEYSTESPLAVAANRFHSLCTLQIAAGSQQKPASRQRDVVVAEEFRQRAIELVPLRYSRWCSGQTLGDLRDNVRSLHW
ncbi:hypothetical protein D3227_29945 [Mesorhizobium waimense]|uniref:Uncharacterized protein n=1 Tax=Mesorhizobium waimense TaxID=1300307 RepID=A0A3A5K6P2_9HYPH|nr:hypothetical protein D3227_29945 [Mesorhizobium waimense]